MLTDSRLDDYILPSFSRKRKKNHKKNHKVDGIPSLLRLLPIPWVGFHIPYVCAWTDQFIHPSIIHTSSSSSSQSFHFQQYRINMMQYFLRSIDKRKSDFPLDRMRWGWPNSKITVVIQAPLNASQRTPRPLCPNLFQVVGKYMWSRIIRTKKQAVWYRTRKVEVVYDATTGAGHELNKIYFASAT